MKKGSIFMLLVLVAALLLSGCTESQTDEVALGFIGPMTGNYANYGQLQSQAVKLAIEQRNEQNPLADKQFTLIVEDSEGDVARGQAAIEKLASVDKITALVGGVFSGVTLAIAPRAQAEQITTISASATAPEITDIGDYIFRTVATDSLQGIVFAHYVYKELNMDRVAILYIRNDYSQGLAEFFQQEFESLGGEIVAMESGLEGDRDFRTQLTSIRSTEPQAIFLPNYVAEIAQILEQADQLGIDAQMLSADGFNNPQIFDLAGPLANGVIFSDSEMQESAEFRRQFRETYDDDPDGFSFNAYDAANILMDAIAYAYEQASDEDKQSLNLDRSLIRDYVAQTENYDGVSGTISFFPNGDVIRNIGVSTVEDDEMRDIGVYTMEGDNLVKLR
ncbi:MAG: ABC transporter substrate-binding protein [Spirochaeta sp.]